MKRILAVILLYSSFSHSADVCRNIKTDQQLFLCSQSKRDSADKYLNIQYRMLLDKINNVYRYQEILKQEHVKKIKVAQRDWIKFRDSNCKLYALQIDDRTQAYQTAFNECVAKMSETRTKELADFFYIPVDIPPGLTGYSE